MYRYSDNSSPLCDPYLYIRACYTCGGSGGVYGESTRKAIHPEMRYTIVMVIVILYEEASLHDAWYTRPELHGSFVWEIGLMGITLTCGAHSNTYGSTIYSAIQYM